MNDSNSSCIPDANSRASANATAATGTATVNRDSQINSSLTVNYAATGAYYKNAQTKYWTRAYGSTISIASQGGGVYWYQIDKITKNACKVVNANTSSSYLQIDYSYVVGCYYGINGIGGVRINQFTVTGTQRFDKSYIP